MADPSTETTSHAATSAKPNTATFTTSKPEANATTVAKPATKAASASGTESAAAQQALLLQGARVGGHPKRDHDGQCRESRSPRAPRHCFASEQARHRWSETGLEGALLFIVMEEASRRRGLE